MATTNSSSTNVFCSYNLLVVPYVIFLQNDFICLSFSISSAYYAGWLRNVRRIALIGKLTKIFHRQCARLRASGRQLLLLLIVYMLIFKTWATLESTATFSIFQSVSEFFACFRMLQHVSACLSVFQHISECFRMF